MCGGQALRTPVFWPLRREPTPEPPTPPSQTWNPQDWQGNAQQGGPVSRRPNRAEQEQQQRRRRQQQQQQQQQQRRQEEEDDEDGTIKLGLGKHLSSHTFASSFQLLTWSILLLLLPFLIMRIQQHGRRFHLLQRPRLRGC